MKYNKKNYFILEEERKKKVVLNISGSERNWKKL
jgi:hypothetical protein